MRLSEFRIDSLFLFSLTAAVLFGLLNLYSAAGGQDAFFRQAAATVIGAAICVVFAHTDYRLLRRYSFFLYLAGLAVLALTWKFGHEVKSTRSWIDLGLFSVQPSELFKALFILQVAAYLGKMRPEERAGILRGLLWPAALMAIPVGLVLLQRDVGTAAVYVPVFLTMLLMADLHFSLIGFLTLIGGVAGARICAQVFRQSGLGPAPLLLDLISRPPSLMIFLAGLAVGGVLILIRLRRSRRGGALVRLGMLVWLIVFSGVWMGDRVYTSLKPHQKTRIAAFFMPHIDPHGSSYQAQQAQIAVGSGGIFGRGYLKGTQKRLGFLPEQTTDFAYSVLAEEWGFAGSALMLLLYGCLIGAALEIARNATELYGCLLSVGAASVYFVHVAVGTAMNLGVFPVVGIPMPFLSYGGSAQVLNFALAGLILSVSKHRRLLAA